jgi:hypothetical protein
MVAIPGFAIGTIILSKVLYSPLPSIAAASISSVGYRTLKERSHNNDIKWIK